MLMLTSVYIRVDRSCNMVPRVDLGEWVVRLVEDYINSPNNSFNDIGEPAWDKPLVGFSSGADPLYSFYRSDIGSFYVLPTEFMRGVYPSLLVNPEELTVICWILPQTSATKYDQRKETRMPSERWARARIMAL